MSNQPIESLDIFPAYPDRATYQNVVGVQAPIFDPTIGAIKLWQDPAAVGLPATALMTYTKYNGTDTAPALVQFTVPAGVAARVNMVGKPSFAKYFIQPTDALGTFSINGAIQTVPVQPDTLSLRAQADSLAAIVGATVVDGAAQNAFIVINWPSDEPRRKWMLAYKDGTEVFVGDLISNQMQAGIGAPGHWDTTGGHLAWVVDPVPDGTDKVYPVMDVPKRPLAANETLGLVMVGGLGFQQVMVQTPDVPTSTSTGGDSALLAQIAAQVQFIYNEMGGK